MKKKVLSDKILVYRDVLDSPKEILNDLLETKNSNQNTYLSNWEPWAQSGSRSRASFFKNPTPEELKNKEYLAILKIKEAYLEIVDDYLNYYKNEHFIDRVSDLRFDKSLKNTYELLVSDDISILHHGKSFDDDLVAMNYHTDSHQYDLDAKKYHFFITITFYLNDDYEGGELSFIDEANNSLIFYKPKPGDVLVFPSFYPYFHGVEKVLNGNRYLVRTFLLYYYEGSKEWNSNLLKYGEEKWKKIEEERIKNEWDNEEYFRSVIYLDDAKDLNCHGKKINIELTREEAKKMFLVEWND